MKNRGKEAKEGGKGRKRKEKEKEGKGKREGKRKKKEKIRTEKKTDKKIQNTLNTVAYVTKVGIILTVLMCCHNFATSSKFPHCAYICMIELHTIMLLEYPY